MFKHILKSKLQMWTSNTNSTVNYDYSLSAYSRVLIRPLTRSVIPISLASSLLWPEPFNKKLLILGPRYESDYFLARGYGFAKPNITLVDHFSYSHKVTVGDAHQLDFPAESFDVVIASWILVYSTEHTKMLAEIRRVLKFGSGIAIISGDCHESPHPYDHTNIQTAPYMFDAAHIEKLWQNQSDRIVVTWPTNERVVDSVPQVIFAIQKSSEPQG